MRFPYVRFSLVPIFFILFSAVATAGPARPKVVTLTQPGGISFPAKMWGDETSHGWETSDGHTILKGDDGRWFFVVKDSTGGLVPTLGVVGVDAPPPASLRARPDTGKGTERLLSGGRRAAVRSAMGLSALDAGPSGVVPLPVILANFSDTSHTYSPQSFEDSLFGSGGGSLRSYYEEVSYGKFGLSSGPNGIMGWYDLPYPHDYYGANSGGQDVKPGNLVYDAVKAALNDGKDFSAYDGNGDCYVDVVAVVHQGTSEDSNGPATDIWSQRWSMAEAHGSGSSDYGVIDTGTSCTTKSGTKTTLKIDDFIIMPEEICTGAFLCEPQLATIGVFAHEYGHALGLPDLYSTSDGAASEGVGRWSLMGGGSWNERFEPGDSPAHLDAWSKSFLGWLSPTLVTEPMEGQEIVAAAAPSPDPTKLVYRIGSGSALFPQEYYLIENRFRTGFDYGLPGQGLLVWHIDGTKVSSRLTPNTVNNYECYPGGPSCVKQHNGVAVVQADNAWDLEKGNDRGDSGDPFPGSSSKTYFGRLSSPSSKWYDGTVSGVAIRKISAPAMTMTATLDPAESCTYLVTPSSVMFPPGGGVGTVAISVPEGCPATPAVTTDVGWLHNPTLSSSKIKFTVDANPTGSDRSGSIKVGDDTVTVTVSGNGAPLQLRLNSVVASTVFRSQMFSGSVRRGTDVAVTVTMEGDGPYAAAVEDGEWHVTVPLHDGPNSYTVTATDGSVTDVLPQGTITVAASLAGSAAVIAETRTGGSVTPQGRTDLAVGTTGTWIVKADSGYSLLNVYVADLTGTFTPVGRKSRYAFKKVTGDHGIYALFTRKSYKISASAGKGGIVAAVQPSVKYGDSTSVTFAPLTGYRLSRLVVDGRTVCGTSLTPSCADTPLTQEFLNVDRNHSVKASFSLQ